MMMRICLCVCVFGWERENFLETGLQLIENLLDDLIFVVCINLWLLLYCNLWMNYNYLLRFFIGKNDDKNLTAVELAWNS